MLPHIHTDNFSKVLHQYSTVELENMVQQYPYFHQAHLLLAKKYQDEKNSKFDEQLQLAVLYAQDRELLYHIFSNQETSTWPSEPDWNIAVSLHEESRTEEAEERVNTEEIEEEIYTEEAEEKVFTEEVEEKIFTEAEIAVSDDIPAEAVEQHPIILVRMKNRLKFKFRWKRKYLLQANLILLKSG
ncbi:MAG: hypothetical protein IPP77_01045 [Bacteroidetes bacterium]|nr:hypothetical protein [Bacteroidota bacterium]